MFANTPQQLGLVFRDLREKQGMTQQEAAAWAGLKPKTVSGFETGKVSIRIDTLLKLFAAVGAVMDVKSEKEMEAFQRTVEW